MLFRSDSAQKPESIVSHAKELNYVPRSAASSKATVSFTVTANTTTGVLTVPQGTIFSGQNANGNYTFVTTVTQNYTSANNTYAINNLNIYEGSYFQESFVVDYTQETQRFILSNPNIDTSSLTIIATESGVNTQFFPVSTTYNLSNTSNVYFLQAAQNGQYEVVFGDGILGRIPNNLSVITANYIITNGDAADGVSSFTIAQDLGAFPGNGGSIVPSQITTVANSSGGTQQEPIESIRKFAPRYFATQQRAVASDDYSSLILANYNTIISDVNVYGGEQLTQKQYGAVCVCLKPVGGTIAPDYVKNQISNFLLNYITIPARVIITDPDYIYLVINSTVQYDQTQTTKLSSELQSIVVNTINQYGMNNLEVFNADFRYSRMVTQIDNADSSITSNSTDILLAKRLSPLLNTQTTYTLNFNNPADVEQFNPQIGYNAYTAFSDEPVVTSTAFTYVDSNNVQTPLCYIRDDNIGNLIVYTDINGKFTVINPSLGVIDYATGTITINKLTVSSYNNYIYLYMAPLNKDAIVRNSLILNIDPADITVTMEQTVK